MAILPKALFTAVLTVLLSFMLVSGAAAAVESEVPLSPNVTPSPPAARSFWDKLEQLRDDRQLQELVEEDLEKSLAIRALVQVEVDRTFSHTTTLINVMLGILTFLPILAAVSVWFIRRSVINQIIGETKQQLKAEVEKQFEQDVAAEFKEQTEAFKQELDKLRAEFIDQLSQLKSLFVDAQKEKDQIIQELSQITPSPIRESAPPETQQKIQALTKQLARLKSVNNQLSFTAGDYVEQGKALYFENQFEDAFTFYEKAIQLEPENFRAWFGKGAVLVKLQKTDEAIAAYEIAIQFKPDFAEAWFGKGTGLAKLAKLADAIAAYETAIQLKPDFFLAWFGKARSYALQGNIEATLKSLQQAIHLNPEKAKEAAKTDTSFDAMREDQRFQSLTAPQAELTDKQ
ncbi:MAG: tetratricopeptide repeat protein [Stenomitos rutilans HA7619-LM2]|jgi:tetratricopeptide (TPR) repeat protein|nr:tetratricopeptide repeat protein [Stenomitos rutilans HA7619-LM2]